MKFKYPFALVLILTALLLLGSAAASENITNNANSSETTYLSVDSADAGSVNANLPVDEDVLENTNKEIIKDNSANQPSQNTVDLIVDMELGDIEKNTYGINEMSFKVPFIITAKANDGTAKNTKVYVDMPNDFQFISSYATVGTYDYKRGIWNIGDLNEGTDATLTIMTNINVKGTFIVFVNGTTDSNDIDLSNNALRCSIQVTSKITSNTTRTSAQQSETQHNTHYASIAQRESREYDWENMPQPYERPSPNTEPERPGPVSTSDDQSETRHDSHYGSTSHGGASGNAVSPSGNGGVSSSVSKQINSNLLTNAIESLFTQDSSSRNNDPSNSKTVKAINTGDYRTIAVLIFTLFLIILVCNLGYEKIKS